MPELPDVTVYLERLEPRVVGRPIEDVRIRSSFLVRTFDPPVSDAAGKVVRELRRLGKRIVLGLDDDLFLVFHLMIAGRFRWRERGAKIHRTQGLCALDFETGTLMMTEASKKKRASLHVVRGEAALDAHQPGGLEPLGADPAAFAAALRRENRTLKRALTDPRLFSGIGNAYSDEILHAARLSPAQRTGNLDDAEVERLRVATEGTLTRWIERTRAEVGDGFPDKVTAFRDGMAVHGRYGEPCPVCGDPVQRIVYAENESNYCATCQTGGKLLADRALSRLFRGDWPRSLEELEHAKNAD
ncbi:MAG: Fpg/Nei family DNA glycosylase [Planctomycetota bacterium JB042]